MRLDCVDVFGRWILTKNYKALSKGLKGNMGDFMNIIMEDPTAFLVRPPDAADDHKDPLRWVHSLRHLPQFSVVLVQFCCDVMLVSAAFTFCFCIFVYGCRKMENVCS